MTVLITGGLGVIGSRLSAHLRDKGYDVIVADRALGPIVRPSGFEPPLLHVLRRGRVPEPLPR